MNDRRFRISKYLTLSMLVLLVASSTLFAQDAKLPFGFGDIALPEKDYKDNQLSLETLDMISPQKGDLNLQPEFDARARGWVTEAKNQGACGSCWAFAAIGTVESRILKDGGSATDLSEQHCISCNSLMSGCCGGSGTSLKFFLDNRPMSETAVPYAETSTECPTQQTKSCDSISGPTEPYLAGGFYAVERTTPAMKVSLVAHGPSYFRFNVYSDFTTFWNSATPGMVYKNTGGAVVGGHAVLLIGWSDSKKAFLLKNSWGKTGGPNKDGTFWLAYDGHTNDLGLQLFNITTLNRVLEMASTRLAKKDPKASPNADSKTPLTSGFEAADGLLKSLPAAVHERAEGSRGPDAVAGFGWYNNLRVNGNTRLSDSAGTTQISVYAADVRWRYAFDGPPVTSPSGDGGTAGAGWQFPNAHKFGIVVFQGNRYWNVNSTSGTQPTVITGLSNTEPVVVTINDTVGNYADNGGAFDLYLRKDN